MTGCFPKSGGSAGTTSEEDQNNRLSALESWKGTADSKLATYTNQQGAIDSLKEQLAAEKVAREALESYVATLEDDLVALQGEVGSGGTGDTVNGETLTTRWTPSVEFEGLAGWNYSVDLTRHPTSIREADTYKMKVTVTNEDTGAVALACRDVVLYVYFSPSSRDTNIDINNTGLYFTGESGVTSYGSIFWDSEFSPSDGVGCRWMQFVSEEFDVNELAMNGTTGDSFSISFDFDLYYAD